MSLAGALKGIVSQRLVQRCDRDGRVPAMEVLVSTGARLRQDRRLDRRPTSSRRSSPTASTTGCRRSTRACCTSTPTGWCRAADALSTASNPHDLRLKMEQYEMTAGAGAHRRCAAARPLGLTSGHRFGRGRAAPHGSQWRPCRVPPRLAPLLAPDAPVQRVARALVDAGHECYLVGGSVRDALIDDVPVEFDFATDARPDRIEALLAPDRRPRVAAGQAVRHRRRPDRRRPAARSRPTGPRCTGPTAASRRSPSATRSSRTSPGATSP